MTRGQIALREAARLESARIYGATLPRTRTPAIPVAEQERRVRDDRIILLHRAGESVAAIALRLGVSKSLAHRVIHDHEQQPTTIGIARGAHA